MIQHRVASLLTTLVGALAILLLLISVVLSGGQPPWAWGFLQSLVLVLGGLWILVQLVSPGPEVWSLTGTSGRWFAIVGLLLLGWIGCSYWMDASGWSARGIEPLARTPTVFALFLAACFLLGTSLGARRRLTALMGVLLLLGVAVGVFGLLRLFTSQWPSLWGFPSGDRLQSWYTNANRVAVLLAICWACGAGWTGYWWCRATRHRGQGDSRWERLIAVLVAAFTLLTAVAMVLTLSRMTLLSSLLSILLVTALSTYAIRHPRGTQASDLGTQPRMRTQLFSLGLILVVVLLLLGLSLTVGGHQLARRMEVVPLDMTGRLELMETGTRLWSERPLEGMGLGTLESRFGQVSLRSQQDWRVVEVHNDWLQVGIELGAVGLLLTVALAVAFGTVWWRSMMRVHRLRTRMLLAGGGVAILVPLLCSLADFPLRQPTTAGLLFLLAGALLQAGLEDRSPEARDDTPLPKGRRWSSSGIGAGLLMAFAVGAVFCLHRGQAVAATPWAGWVYPPVPVAEDARDYEIGCRMDSGNPDLWFLYALALSEHVLEAPIAEHKKKDRLQFEDATEHLICLNPFDYRPYYVRGTLAYRERRWNDGLGYIRQALRFAHFSFLHDLERDLLILSLRSLSAEDPRRAERLEEALACLKQGVQEQRWSEEQSIEALLKQGVQPSEAVQYWATDGDRNRIARARFYVRFGLNERARAELNSVSVSGQNGAWFLALRCFLDLVGQQEDRGLESFGILARKLEQQHDPRVLAWLQAHMPMLPGDRLLRLVRNEPGLGAHPALCRAILPKISAVSLADADRFWGRAVKTSATPENLRQWAELAAQMGDRPAARTRARDAWERSNRTDEWNRWYAEFRRKWKLNE